MFTFQKQHGPPGTGMTLTRRSHTYNKRKNEIQCQWDKPQGISQLQARKRTDTPQPQPWPESLPSPTLTEQCPLPEPPQPPGWRRVPLGRLSSPDARGKAMRAPEEAETVTRKPKHQSFNQCSVYKSTSWRAGMQQQPEFFMGSESRVSRCIPVWGRVSQLMFMEYLPWCYLVSIEG